MRLPPVPYHPEIHTYTWTKLEIESIEAYGALCRKMALEEAAKEVDHIMFFNGKTFGEKIRELK